MTSLSLLVAFSFVATALIILDSFVVLCATPAGEPSGRQAFWTALCWAAMLLALIEITGLA